MSDRTRREHRTRTLAAGHQKSQLNKARKLQKEMGPTGRIEMEIETTAAASQIKSKQNHKRKKSSRNEEKVRKTSSSKCNKFARIWRKRGKGACQSETEIYG